MELQIRPGAITERTLLTTGYQILGLRQGEEIWHLIIAPFAKAGSSLARHGGGADGALRWDPVLGLQQGEEI